jgi:hypothetical protein
MDLQLIALLLEAARLCLFITIAVPVLSSLLEISTSFGSGYVVRLTVLPNEDFLVKQIIIVTGQASVVHSGIRSLDSLSPAQRVSRLRDFYIARVYANHRKYEEQHRAGSCYLSRTLAFWLPIRPISEHVLSGDVVSDVDLRSDVQACLVHEATPARRQVLRTFLRQATAPHMANLWYFVRYRLYLLGLLLMGSAVVIWIGSAE